MTTSEDENLLEHCAQTMHVTCVAMSLDKLEPERQHGSDTHPHSRAFSPVLGSGVTTTAGSLDQRLPNFPRVHPDSFCSFKN